MSAPLNIYIPPEVAQNVVSNVERSESGCWLYRGHVSSKGYGKVRVRRLSREHLISAHRVAYEYLRGPIPEGLELDHLCRVRHCINPEHLEPVTHSVNVRRGISPWGEMGRRPVCPKGHELAGRNLYLKPVKHFYKRQCRTCRAESRAKWRAKTGRR